MDGDGFLNAFMGVDILKVEGVGEIVGRTHAALFKGMTEAGMTEKQATTVLANAHREFFKAVFASFASAGTKSSQ